jgi:hypothetical protein
MIEGPDEIIRLLRLVTYHGRRIHDAVVRIGTPREGTSARERKRCRDDTDMVRLHVLIS